MKQYVIISSLILLLFLSTLIFIVFREKSVTNLEAAYIINPIPQKVEKRVWKEKDFQKVGASNELISSSHLRFDENDFIYVSDNNNQIVKRYDLNGNLSKIYGNGLGRGPGEFLAIIDLLISEDKKLWVVDDRNVRVTVFETEKNNEWKIIDFDFAFNKILPMNKNKYWVEKKFDSQMVIYNIDGELLGSVEPLVKNPRVWAYVLEGFYSLVPEGGVVQSQYHTNSIVRYSEAGDILFFREPIEFLGLPKIDPHYANDVARINTVDYSSWLQISSDPHVAGNSIHVFVKQKDIKSNEWKKGFMDVYDLMSGDYEYSYDLPESIEALTVTTNYIAGISDKSGKLNIWKFEN